MAKYEDIRYGYIGSHIFLYDLVWSDLTIFIICSLYDHFYISKSDHIWKFFPREHLGERGHDISTCDLDHVWDDIIVLDHKFLEQRT